jgi:hypothetical protein
VNAETETGHPGLTKFMTEYGDEFFSTFSVTVTLSQLSGNADRLFKIFSQTFMTEGVW